MLQIRNNVFETNSSSTHSLVVCSDDEWARFMKGELWLNTASHELEDGWKSKPFTYSLPKFLTQEMYDKNIKKIQKEWVWKDGDLSIAMGWINMVIFKSDYLDDFKKVDGGYDVEHFFG